MKKLLPKKSRSHAKKLNAITNIILKHGKNKIAFIILFGSFARGDWVRDIYDERKDDGTVGYASDYDILIITKTKKQAAFGVTNRLIRNIQTDLANYGITRYSDLLEHSVNIIIEPLDRVNSEISKKHYFFYDIKKEGVMLYDSGEFILEKPKKLDNEKRAKIAKKDYEYWFERGDNFLKTAKFCFTEKDLRNSAFLLHQTTESFYHAILLTFSNYKPRTHRLEKLGKDCASHSPKFLSIFPQAKEENKKCFELLCSAYVDARYDQSYSITKKQLEYLFKRVEILKKYTKVECERKIGELGILVRHNFSDGGRN